MMKRILLVIAVLCGICPVADAAPKVSVKVSVGCANGSCAVPRVGKKVTRFRLVNVFRVRR